MIISDERSPAPGIQKGDLVYDPDILPELQSLLATLADLDIAHGSNLLVIESRNMDDARKDQLIAEPLADPLQAANSLRPGNRNAQATDGSRISLRWCHEGDGSHRVRTPLTIEERLASHLDRVNIDEVVREGILLRRLTAIDMEENSGFD